MSFGYEIELKNLNTGETQYIAGSESTSGPLDVSLINGVLKITTDGTYDFGSLDLNKTHFSNAALSSLSDGDQVPSSGLNGFESETSGVRLAVSMDSADKRAADPSILCENDGDNNGPANSTLVFDYGSDIPENTKVVWSSWDKFTPNSSLGGDGQWKMRRLGKDNNITDNDAELGIFRTNNAVSGNGLNLLARTNDGQITNVAQSGGTIEQANFPQFDDQWRRTDQFIETGTAGNYDGNLSIIGHYPDKSQSPELLPMTTFEGTASYPEQQRLLGSDSDQLRYFIHQNFFGNGDGSEPLKNFGAQVRHDSIFIQVGSYRRLELCNNADYTLATHREILNWTSWTNDEIEAEFRQGAFPNGTAWVHVMGDNGVADSIASAEVTI